MNILLLISIKAKRLFNVKLRYFMKPAKKSLVYLGGKMRFEFWPLWQCWAVWPIQILFSRQGRLKIFLAGFIDKYAFIENSARLLFHHTEP